MSAIPQNISVFSLDRTQIHQLSQTRLYPQENDRARWGCASLSGFLAPMESLMDVARADQITLRDHSVSYPTIAERLLEITGAATRALGRPSSTPVLVENDKFEVILTGHTSSHQFCPFSPEDDRDAGPSTNLDHMCPSSGNDWSIRNTKNGKSIRFGGLLPHLIGAHNFFLGQVPHRLDPLQVIETLELPPEENPTLEASLTESANSPKVTSTKHKEICSWDHVGSYEMPAISLEEIAKCNEASLEEIEEGIYRINLPYYHGVHGSAKSIKIKNPNNLIYTHIFNTNSGGKITFSKVLDGALLKTTLNPRSNVIFLLQKNEDAFQESKRSKTETR